MTVLALIVAVSAYLVMDYYDSLEGKGVYFKNKVSVEEV